MASGHELNAAPWTRVEGTLLSTARSLRRAYDRLLKPSGVNLKEASVLAHLADAGRLTQVDLAHRIGTGRANLGVTVDSLVTRGLVERQADPDDRRVWLVALTAAGERVWMETVEVDRAIRHRLRVGTSVRERDVLDGILMRIYSNLQGILDEES